MHLRAGEIDVRLPGKRISNSHGARPVHLIISMIKWIRTSRLSIKNSLSLWAQDGKEVVVSVPVPVGTRARDVSVSPTHSHSHSLSHTPSRFLSLTLTLLDGSRWPSPRGACAWRCEAAAPTRARGSQVSLSLSLIHPPPHTHPRPPREAGRESVAWGAGAGGGQGGDPSVALNLSLANLVKPDEDNTAGCWEVVRFWQGPLVRVTLVKSLRQVSPEDRLLGPFMWDRICASGRQVNRDAVDPHLSLAAVHTRFAPLTHSLTHTHSHSLSHTLSLSHSLILSLTHTHSHSLSLSLSLSWMVAGSRRRKGRRTSPTPRPSRPRSCAAPPPLCGNVHEL